MKFLLRKNSRDQIDLAISMIKSDVEGFLKQRLGLDLSNPDAVKAYGLKKAKLKDDLASVVDAVEAYDADETLDVPKHLKGLILKVLISIFGVVQVPISFAAHRFTPPTIHAKDCEEGDIPLVTAGVKPTKYIKCDDPRLDDTVVVSRSGYAGFVSFYSGPHAVTHSMCYEGVSGATVTKYLYYAMKQLQPIFRRLAAGTGISNLSGQVVDEFKISVPTLEVQEKFVAEMEKLEYYRSDLEAELDKARQLYQLAFKCLLNFNSPNSKFKPNDETVVQQRLTLVKEDLSAALAEAKIESKLVDALTEEQKQQLQKFVLNFKDKDDLVVVDDYTQVCFDLLIYVYGMINLKLEHAGLPFSPEVMPAKDFEEGNIPLIAGGRKPTKYVSFDRPKLGESVIIARTGTAGFVSYYNEPIVLIKSIGLEGRTGVTLTKFLYHSTKRLEPQFMNSAVGTTVPGVKPSEVKATRIKVPSLEVQQTIVEKLNIAEEHIKNLEAELALVEKTYKLVHRHLLTVQTAEE